MSLCVPAVVDMLLPPVCFHFSSYWSKSPQYLSYFAAAMYRCPPGICDISVK